MDGMEFLVAGSVAPVVQVGVCSVAGAGRAVNQDAVAAGPTWYAVADGVGGHGAGEVASALAIDLLAASPAPGSPADVVTTIARINATIHERSRHEAAATATTLVGVVEIDGRVEVFHLGDSRCYQLVDDVAVARTHDHSYVQELVDAGLLSADDARTDRRRNVITRALGVESHCRPDIATIEMTSSGPEATRLLLCSDGVSSVLAPDRIGRELAVALDPQSAAESLVRAALAAGTRDDATALVVDGLGHP